MHTYTNSEPPKGVSVYASEWEDAAQEVSWKTLMQFISMMSTHL